MRNYIFTSFHFVLQGCLALLDFIASPLKNNLSSFVYFLFLKEISSNVTTHLLTLLGLSTYISGICVHLSVSGMDSPSVHLIAFFFFSRLWKCMPENDKFALTSFRGWEIENGIIEQFKSDENFLK